MIASLTGTVRARSGTAAVIEVSGVGYRVLMSTGSLAALPVEGDDVTVHTYLHVREDELTLYGFESAGEQAAFERLITVSGVGPKVALAILSALSPEELAGAIAARDVALISSVPGIGKKTAERLCLELRDKLSTDSVVGPTPGAGADEARAALLAMGFSSAEVGKALGGFSGDGSDAEEMLKYALGRLGGGR